MDLFVSYAREDAPAVTLLAARLQDLGHRVWFDKELTGGQVWWDQVLQNIRTRDAVVLALSPAYSASEACESERIYAVRAGRPLLPVQVAPLAPETLPSDLGRLQIVDYSNPDESSAIRLARAVAALPTAPASSPPYPEPPPVPYSYLSQMAEQVRHPPPTQEAQLELVSRLESTLKNPDLAQRRAAADLLAAMQQHPDIYAETYHRIGRLGPAIEAARTPAATPTQTTGAPSSAQTETSGTPGYVKILAWIGLAVVILFGIGLCSGGGEAPCFDYLGNEVAC